MNYEQEYIKALERAKSKIKNDKDHVLYEDDVIEIFPELAESEDERIRKSILEHIQLCSESIPNRDIWIAWLEKQYKKDSQVTLPSFTFDDILALQCCMETVKKVQEDKDLYEKLKDLHGRVYDAYQLEKQGEQKPVEWCSEDEQNLNVCLSYIPHEFLRRWLKDIIHIKYDKPIDRVEPKFKIGDWIVYNRNDHSRKIMQIYDIRDNRYYFNDNIHFSWSVKECDEKSHLWTIKDAKDGDVLVYGDNPNHNHVEVIMLFKSLRSECSANTHFHIFNDQFRNDDWCDCGKNVHPATKEQRDLLFQKMKEAGYEWNKDKKKLIKL